MCVRATSLSLVSLRSSRVWCFASPCQHAVYSNINNPVLHRLSYTRMCTVRGTHHVECGQQRAVRHRKIWFCCSLQRPHSLCGLHKSMFGACRNALSAESKRPEFRNWHLRPVSRLRMCVAVPSDWFTIRYSTAQHSAVQYSTVHPYGVLFN